MAKVELRSVKLQANSVQIATLQESSPQILFGICANCLRKNILRKKYLVDLRLNKNAVLSNTTPNFIKKNVAYVRPSCNTLQSALFSLKLHI